MRNKLFLSILLVLVLASSSFAAVGYQSSGTPVGAATDINISTGLAASSFDGSTLTISAATAAITGGVIAGTTINSSTIGATSPSTGAFTTLSTTGAATVGTTLGVSGNTTLSGGTTTIAGTLTAATGTLTGGSINGATIGNSSPSTGAFTTLAASAATALSSTLAVSGNTTLSGGTTTVAGTLSAATASLTGKLSAKVVAHATSVLTSSPTVSVDASGNDIFYIDPTSTGTLTAAGFTAGQVVRLIVYTGSSASTGTLTFSTGFKSTGTLTMPALAGKYSLVTFVCDGSKLIQMGTFMLPL